MKDFFQSNYITLIGKKDIIKGESKLAQEFSNYYANNG